MVLERSRAPSAALAKAALKKRALRNKLKDNKTKVEAASRKAGGYGKKVCSIWEAPKGGIEKSPAWQKLLTRCELDKKGRPPPPERRDGAPVKGGFPLKKYPPNVIVDNLRASWLPDDWAQVIKNTGPGGTYLGWMSPEGKFAYHRFNFIGSVEDVLGRKLSVVDGYNGLMRSVRRIVKPGADKAFLHELLTPKERKFVRPASDFHFCVVSGRRATLESGQHDIYVVEDLFNQVNVKPTWYVDADSLQDYKNLGLNAKVGGKLTPARNMCLDDAAKKKKVCVQISDDISKWVYYDCEKQDFRGEVDFKKANLACLGTKVHIVSPLAAAQFMLAKMRADPDKPKLAGVFPTQNAAMTLGSSEFGKAHFILGDFFVAEYASPCRFDCSMTLKEDYDYTCSHLKQHGSVLRCNRMFLHVKHATNAGGAVAARDTAGAKEKANIAILQKKWPGVFRINGRRKGTAGTEVTMNWGSHGKENKKGEKVKKGEKKFCTKAGKVSGETKKTQFKKAAAKIKALAGFPTNAVLRYTKKVATADYVNSRSSRCHLKTIGACLGMKYKDAKGQEKTYGYADLKYDVHGGRLEVSKQK